MSESKKLSTAQASSTRVRGLRSQMPSDWGGANAVLLGLNQHGSDKGVVWLPEIGGHSITIGSTRSGKGTNQIIPALIKYGGSTVVIDPKGENAWITAQRRRELGQKVIILDPWNNVNTKFASKFGLTEPIGKFNPLGTLNPSSPEFADDVLAIADAVIIPNERDSHWTDSARELVAGLIAATVMRAPGIANFGDVRRLIVGDNKRLIDTIETIRRTYPGSYAAAKLTRFTADNREIESIKSTANTQTSILDTAALLSSMETDANAFNLAELATGRATLYLVLPVDKLQTHGRWLRLILTLAIKAISRQPTPPRPPVLFILDEFGTITPGVGGGLKMIEQSVGLMAGMGIRIWAFLQDITQLQRDYPYTWQTFISNAEVISLLRVNDNATADYFEKALGDRTVKISHEDQRGFVTYSYQKRPLMFASEIKSIPKNKVIILESGGKNFNLYSTPYFLEPRWNGLYRPHPDYINAAPMVPADSDDPLAKAAKAALKMAEAGASRFKSWVDAKAKESREARASATAASPQADLSEREKWTQRIKDAK